MRALVLALCCALVSACGGGAADLILIGTVETLSADVAIVTSLVQPGTEIHGPGVGAGGGNCGRVTALFAYRTTDRIVFAVEEGLNFCFGSDIYQVILDNVVFQGAPGRMVFLNNGDPRVPGNAAGLAFFQPDGAAGFFVSGINVAQFMLAGVDNLLFLSVRPTDFAFWDNIEDNSAVFPIRIQIERVLGDGTSPIIDITDFVNVDLVDPDLG
ncbi:MAG: hypothetical protein OER88_02565 [Planctomycetota bacterium]|nr:hypothetical protein [Planctomycetota bacterium]